MSFALTPFRGDKGLEPAKKFYVCDIEAYKWTKFRTIGFYDGSKFTEWRSLKDFFTFISSDDKDKQIFAHFGGIYDFLFLIEWISKSDLENRFKLGTIVPRGSALLCFDVTYNYEYAKNDVKQVKLSFNDSSALLGFGLKSLTKSFKVEHEKQEFDFDKWDGKITPKLLSYLKDDCRGLYEVIERYRNWNLVKRAGHASTMASQALKIYRSFMTKEIYPLSKSADDFTRKAYFGGRTEIFKPYFDGEGKEKLKNFDVNSLYPYTMLKNSYPIASSHFTNKYVDNKLGIYHVEVEVPEDMYIPVLGLISSVPSEHRVKGKVVARGVSPKYVFPTGRFSGYWTNSEIEYAKRLGVKIRKVHNGLIFIDGGLIFEKYINILYEMRLKAKQSGDSVTDIICKLLMNSLYGRFGMNPNKKNIVLTDYFDDSTGEKPWREFTKESGEKLYLIEKEVELRSFSNSAISCFVTSNSRVHMHQQFTKLKNKIWYTDTDSLFTTEKIEESDKLGGLKLEYESNRACFILPKTYITEGDSKKVTMKGFERKKIQHFTVEHFKSVLEGETGVLSIKTSAKFCRFKTALRKGEFLSMMGEQSRSVVSQYDKRRVIKTMNGDYDTVPLHIENGKVVN